MDTDHDQLSGIFGLEPLQVGNDVHAIDAAIGPEIEHDDLAAVLGETEFRVIQDGFHGEVLGILRQRGADEEERQDHVVLVDAS